MPGQIEQRPGGAALNVALGLAARGLSVRLCSAIGADAAGVELVAHIEAAGVGCTDVVRIDGAATSHYLAIEDRDGDLFAAVADTGLIESHETAIAVQADMALPAVDAVFLDANLTTSAIMRISARAVELGVEIIANPVGPAKAPRLADLISSSYQPKIVLNLAEANVLAHAAHDTAAAAAEALLRHGAGTALVTDGPRPAALTSQHGIVTATPPSLTGRVSATGAGDALLAAFLAFPDRDGHPQAALAAALHGAAQQMTVRT